MELKPGDKLGPYEIISAIGKGGMGEVWKARDPRLGREVAIKVLAQQFSFRFDREARAIAALNHPNICQIHDIGPDYLVLEYIDGKRLCGPLPAEECVRVALQVAAALEEAHARGILHCDLKPANIMMTTSGSAKLLDFGLAKLIGDGDATQTRAVMGTPAYMAPEQLQGKPADARSEIFSFGLVLYELLSGRQAFAGGAATVRDEPAPLDASANLSAFVSRCLRKLPAGRFQTMNEVRTALEQATAVATGNTPSVAVLPFINISADKDNEYFSDGLAEEILNALTRFPDLKVTARTSAFSFRGKDLDIRKIGEALGVRTVLEGSVRRAGNRIRVTAQLINIADGYQLWSERYDRDMTDIFAVQDEISAAIVDALKVKLAPAKILHPPMNLEAYHALLKARHAALLLTPETAQLGLAYADEAIALDSGYALAHSVRAQYLFGLAQIGRKPARETLPLARAAALRALELDDTLPEAHAVLAIIAAVIDYNWKEALHHYRISRIEDPNLATACAVIILLPLGHVHEAIDLLEKAIARDPLFSSFPQTNLALTVAASGDYEGARKQLLRMLELHEKDFLGHLGLGMLYALQGMTRDAIATLEKGVKLAPWFPPLWGLLAANYQLAGNRIKAEALLMLPRMASVTGHPVVDMARGIYHIAVGDLERAADLFGRAVEARHYAVLFVAWDPFYRDFRQTPRGSALLAKMNLVGIPIAGG